MPHWYSLLLSWLEFLCSVLYLTVTRALELSEPHRIREKDFESTPFLPPLFLKPVFILPHEPPPLSSPVPSLPPSLLP